MKNLTKRKKEKEQWPYIHTRNSVRFGSNSLKCLGLHFWDTVPGDIKELSSF